MKGKQPKAQGSEPPRTRKSPAPATATPAPKKKPGKADSATSQSLRIAKAQVSGQARPLQRKARAKAPQMPTEPAPEVLPPQVQEPEVPQPPASARDIAAEIRALEARVDSLMAEHESDAEAPATAAEEDGPPSDDSAESSPKLPENLPTAFDVARELFATQFYVKKWGRLAMRERAGSVDHFGYDPAYEERARPVLDFLYDRYFRVRAQGLENVPASGRCLLVANHSGTLPLDGLMLKMAVKRAHAAARPVRWLTEDDVHHLPFLGTVGTRLGAVRACQENAERLLREEELVAVFPEGVKGPSKLFRDRYRLQRFGRGGFIKLCLRTGTPIIPVSIVGAEETAPLLFRVEVFARALGLSYVPITPTFPALGPLGLLPAPTKWSIDFGEPVDLGEYGPQAADDDLLVGKLSERVRATIQSMVDRSASARRSVFFG